MAVEGRRVRIKRRSHDLAEQERLLREKAERLIASAYTWGRTGGYQTGYKEGFLKGQAAGTEGRMQGMLLTTK